MASFIEDTKRTTPSESKDLKQSSGDEVKSSPDPSYRTYGDLSDKEIKKINLQVDMGNVFGRINKMQSTVLVLLKALGKPLIDFIKKRSVRVDMSKKVEYDVCHVFGEVRLSFKTMCKSQVFLFVDEEKDIMEWREYETLCPYPYQDVNALMKINTMDFEPVYASYVDGKKLLILDQNIINVINHCTSVMNESKNATSNGGVGTNIGAVDASTVGRHVDPNISKIVMIGDVITMKEFISSCNEFMQLKSEAIVS